MAAFSSRDDSSSSSLSSLTVPTAPLSPRATTPTASGIRAPRSVPQFRKRASTDSTSSTTSGVTSLVSSSSTTNGNNSNSNNSDVSVRVMVRLRPSMDRVNAMDRSDYNPFGFALTITDDSQVNWQQNGSSSRSFMFDRAFGPDTNQEEFYNQTARQTIDDVLNGYNGTVFAYGQTGSGKTFSMFGPLERSASTLGIIPRAARQLFSTIAKRVYDVQYAVKCSFLEVYLEEVYDLLTPVTAGTPQARPLQVRESKERGVHVPGLIERVVTNEREVEELIAIGEATRSVAATNINERSSRSHSVFILMVEQRSLSDSTAKVGRLNLVDLAGSERVSRSGATGQTLEEARQINTSLSALGNCVNALTTPGRGHVPYRDSTLTRVLQDSLGGNTKTTLVVTVAASPSNALETLSSLEFGARAKAIRNRAIVNVKQSAEQLERIIKQLRTQLTERTRQLAEMSMRCRSLEAQLSAVAAMALPTVFSGSPRSQHGSLANNTNGSNGTNSNNGGSPSNGGHSSAAVAAAASVAAAAAQAAAAFAFELPHPMTASPPSSPSAANKSIGATTTSNTPLALPSIVHHDDNDHNGTNGNGNGLTDDERSMTPAIDTHDDTNGHLLPSSTSVLSLDTPSNSGDGMIDHFHFDSAPPSPRSTTTDDTAATNTPLLPPSAVATPIIIPPPMPLSLPPPLPMSRPPALPPPVPVATAATPPRVRPLPNIPSPVTTTTAATTNGEPGSPEIVDNWLEAAGIVHDSSESTPPPVTTTRSPVPAATNATASSTSVAVAAPAAAGPSYLHHYHHSPTRTGATTTSGATTTGSGSSPIRSFAVSSPVSATRQINSNHSSHTPTTVNHHPSTNGLHTLRTPQQHDDDHDDDEPVRDFYDFDSPAPAQPTTAPPPMVVADTRSITHSHQHQSQHEDALSNGLRTLPSLSSTTMNGYHRHQPNGYLHANNNDDDRSRSSSISTTASGVDSITDELHHHQHHQLPTFTDRVPMAAAVPPSSQSHHRTHSATYHPQQPSTVAPSTIHHHHHRTGSATYHQPSATVAADAPFITSATPSRPVRRLSATMVVMPASSPTITVAQPPSHHVTPSMTNRMALPTVDLDVSSPSSPLSPMMPIVSHSSTLSAPNHNIATPLSSPAASRTSHTSTTGSRSNGVLSVVSRNHPKASSSSATPSRASSSVARAPRTSPSSSSAFAYGQTRR